MNDIEFLFLFADRNTGMYQPHLGSDYLISLLQKNGYRASRILTKSHERLFDKLLSVKRNNKNSINYILGFTCYDANYQMVKQGIRLARSVFPDAIIFVGGPSASFNDDVLLKCIEGIDLCFLGESEVSMLEFARRLSEGMDYHGIANTSYLENGRLINLGKNCVLDEETMNHYPSPICTQTYDPKEILQRYGKISIITSRGCPHRCSFCAFSLQSNHTVRYYSVKRVIDEISYIDNKLRDIEDISYKKVVIEDDCFTLNKKHFLSITNELIELRPHLLFECQTRADYLDYDTLKRLKLAGFYRVDISLESSNESVLLANHKVETYSKASEYVEKVSKVIKWCKELSLECYTTLICGLPTDSEESVIKTHDFITEQNPTGYYWNNLKVFTGTSLFKDYMEKYITVRDENIFNPIYCNELTYNNISPYHPKNILRTGDDVSWNNRKQRTKQDVFEYLTSKQIVENQLFRINVPNDLKTIAKAMVEHLPLDSRILLFSTEGICYKINSVVLSELQSVALFDNNSNEQIYSVLCDISPVIQLPVSEVLVEGKSVNANSIKNINNKQIMNDDDGNRSVRLNTRDLKEQVMDLLILLKDM